MNSQENKELIKLFEHCRVTDVRDGMDWMGYHHYGSMDPSVRPLFRTRAVGIARTARYIPFEGPVPNLFGDDYSKWSGMYYSEICTYPWLGEIEEGDFMAIDLSGCNAGLMGSCNTLDARLLGCVGYVINGGGIRDTDEVIAQDIPVWTSFISQGMDQARIRFCDKDVPVSIGGVAIYPGDVIVADGDGVIVVPRKIARDVAKYAHQEMHNDKNARKGLYEKLDMELDDTVMPVENLF